MNLSRAYLCQLTIMTPQTGTGVLPQVQGAEALLSSLSPAFAACQPSPLAPLSAALVLAKRVLRYGTCHRHERTSSSTCHQHYHLSPTFNALLLLIVIMLVIISLFSCIAVSPYHDQPASSSPSPFSLASRPPTPPPPPPVVLIRSRAGTAPWPTWRAGSSSAPRR
jgi:hypothetical protein